MLDLEKILEKQWGFKSFRPLQKEIIQSLLGGRDTLAILPTGSGKSLCFQLPGLISKGVCLVISPLIALMKDQVRQLKAKNIPAAALYGSLDHTESAFVYQQALDEQIKLLYVSPERLQSTRFQRFLTNARISFIAIDEAHCIAQWGHDFRPAYLNIKEIKHYIGRKPILALTATATPNVEQEITERLALNEARVFRASYIRKELALKALEVVNKESQLISILKKTSGSAIVYCRSRRACKELSMLINQEGIRSSFYHAGLSKEERDSAQNTWLNNTSKVIVSTNAFGMGIDKPDVRLVVHYDLPESLESYYQEVGRAGRDGADAEGVILYNAKSIDRQNEQIALKFPSETKLRALYIDICNYLKIPVGAGKNEFFDFELLAFVKLKNYNMTTALHGMQLLAKQNIWYLSDSVYIPTRVQVMASREELHHLAEHYQRQDVLMKQLLRMYNGIWQYPIPINEYDIASSIKRSVEEVKVDLEFLYARSYIKMIAKKDRPQLYLIDNRYPAEQIVLNYQEVEWHLQREQERLRAMQKFLLNKDQCRMLLLAAYFSAEDSKEQEVCGVCDIDLSSAVKINIDNLKIRLDQALSNRNCIPLEELTGDLQVEERTQILKLIRQMVSEGLYKINTMGEVCIG